VSRGGELVAALVMLAAVALAVWRRDAAFCAAAGLAVHAARILVARGRWTPTGGFGLANALTLLRLCLVAALGWAFVALPRLAFVAALLLVFALDSVDGRLARARQESSPFGAAFDMETDALAIMMLALLLWQHDLVAAWVLIAGLWRYVYAAIVALVPSLGEAPRSQLARVIFVVVALSLSLAFLPCPHLAPLLAALGTLAVSFSFLRSFYYSRPGR
jgi:phosphatidylglycerophosphate synthase